MQRNETDSLEKAEKEKFQEDLNAILIILRLISNSAIGAHFALHFS